MKKLLLICSIFVLGNTYAQVTQSNSTAGNVNGNTATRNIVFTAGDFGGCTSLTDVDIAISWTGGAFQALEQVGMSIQSPTGTTVQMVFYPPKPFL
jgi:hypothetical protein